MTSYHFLLRKVDQSHYRPEVPRGFQEVKAPRLRDNGPGWWQSCQPYGPAAFTPRKYSVKQSHHRPEVPRGFQEVKAPILRDNGPGWWQSCQPYAPAAFTPRKYP